MKSRKRVALVTGGCGAIGAAVARSLASAGFKVVVADLDADRCEELAKSIGGHAVRMDVSEPDAVTGAVREVFEKAGRIDVCVNAAAWRNEKPFLETDEIHSAKVLEINLGGPIRVSRAVLPGMAENGWGRIINIAPGSAEEGPAKEPAFAAAGAGVVALTKTIAKEFAASGVTANAVCPGTAADDFREALASSLPQRSFAVPDDVAPAVAFLASDEAAYITGQTLSVGREGDTA